MSYVSPPLAAPRRTLAQFIGRYIANTRPEESRRFAFAEHTIRTHNLNRADVLLALFEALPKKG